VVKHFLCTTPHNIHVALLIPPLHNSPLFSPRLCAAGAVTDAVGVLLSRGQAAVEAIAAAPDPTSRRDAEAFQQLQLIRQMVELAGQGQWDKVLQVRLLLLLFLDFVHVLHYKGCVRSVLHMAAAFLYLLCCAVAWPFVDVTMTSIRHALVCLEN
jgi:hypothetical protein